MNTAFVRAAEPLDKAPTLPDELSSRKRLTYAFREHISRRFFQELQRALPEHSRSARLVSGVDLSMTEDGYGLKLLVDCALRPEEQQSLLDALWPEIRPTLVRQLTASQGVYELDWLEARANEVVDRSLLNRTIVTLLDLNTEFDEPIFAEAEHEFLTRLLQVDPGAREAELMELRLASQSSEVERRKLPSFEEMLRAARFRGSPHLKTRRTQEVYDRTLELLRQEQIENNELIFHGVDLVQLELGGASRKFLIFDLFAARPCRALVRRVLGKVSKAYEAECILWSDYALEGQETRDAALRLKAGRMNTGFLPTQLYLGSLLTQGKYVLGKLQREGREHTGLQDLLQALSNHQVATAVDLRHATFLLVDDPSTQRCEDALSIYWFNDKLAIVYVAWPAKSREVNTRRRVFEVDCLQDAVVQIVTIEKDLDATPPIRVLGGPLVSASVLPVGRFTPEGTCLERTRSDYPGFDIDGVVSRMTSFLNGIELGQASSTSGIRLGVAVELFNYIGGSLLADRFNVLSVPAIARVRQSDSRDLLPILCGKEVDEFASRIEAMFELGRCLINLWQSGESQKVESYIDMLGGRNLFVALPIAETRTDLSFTVSLKGHNEEGVMNMEQVPGLLGREATHTAEAIARRVEELNQKSARRCEDLGRSISAIADIPGFFDWPVVLRPDSSKKNCWRPVDKTGPTADFTFRIYEDRQTMVSGGNGCNSRGFSEQPGERTSDKILGIPIGFDPTSNCVYVRVLL